MSISFPAGHDLHDAVGRGLDDLVVTGGEEDHAREPDHAVVEGGDGLHVQVVGGLVQDQHVSAPEIIISGQHAADLFASGQNADPLHAVVAGEEHTAQEAAHIGDVLFVGILGQPFHDGVVVLEFCPVVQREVSLGGRDSPLV